MHCFTIANLTSLRPVEVMESLQTAFEDITTNDTAAEHLLRPLYFVYLVLHLLIQLLNEPWTNQPAPDDCRAHFTLRELEQKVMEFNAWAFDVASRMLCHNNNKENTLACIGVISALFLDKTYMRCTVIGRLDDHRPPDH